MDKFLTNVFIALLGFMGCVVIVTSVFAFIKNVIERIM